MADLTLGIFLDNGSLKECRSTGTSCAAAGQTEVGSSGQQMPVVTPDFWFTQVLSSCQMHGVACSQIHICRRCTNGQKDTPQ